MSVHRLPIVDGQPPAEPGPVAALTATLAEHLQAGRTVVVHCRGGLGRAGTSAACTLVPRGLAPEPAMRHVRTARPGAIENRGQEDFVRAFRPR
jgi:protein-tyrosine phosphatase